ncbi:MAG: helix-turn-helix domain-containing protein [Bacteroidetes bacterium]|nr:MAG: helix-turn-helix domain-containing protein [Bacteroidota bacterium]
MHTASLRQRPPLVHFNLQTMEAIYERAGGRTDIPHRHDYYTVLLVERAKGEHLIDYHTYVLGARQVHFVAPGQVHQVNAAARPKGWVITFTREFLVANNIPERFITNINLFRQFGDSPPLDLDHATLDKLTRIISEMESCLPQALHYRDRALGALLQLFLIYCNNSLELDSTQLDEDNSGICLLRDFKDGIEQHFREWHKVADYASEIHISPKHLSQVVKNLTGKTAKDLIQDRLILESKRLLLHTSLSVKEIAYQLGFDEPLHFSSFFKKETGGSPSAFREQGG